MRKPTHIGLPAVLVSPAVEGQSHQPPTSGSAHAERAERPALDGRLVIGQVAVMRPAGLIPPRQPDNRGSRPFVPRSARASAALYNRCRTPAVRGLPVLVVSGIAAPVMTAAALIVRGDGDDGEGQAEERTFPSQGSYSTSSRRRPQRGTSRDGERADGSRPPLRCPVASGAHHPCGTDGCTRPACVSGRHRA
jgi:hypothetical protein